MKIKMPPNRNGDDTLDISAQAGRLCELAGLPPPPKKLNQVPTGKDIYETVGQLFHTRNITAHDVKADRLTKIRGNRLAMVVADEIHQLVNGDVAHAYTLLVDGCLYTLMCMGDIIAEGFSACDGGQRVPDAPGDSKQWESWCEAAGITKDDIDPHVKRAVGRYI